MKTYWIVKCDSDKYETDRGRSEFRSDAVRFYVRSQAYQRVADFWPGTGKVVRVTVKPKAVKRWVVRHLSESVVPFWNTTTRGWGSRAEAFKFESEADARAVVNRMSRNTYAVEEA